MPTARLGFVHHRFINNPATEYQRLIILRRPELGWQQNFGFLAAGLLIKHLLEAISKIILDNC
jgi:hypothetical protein